MVYEIRPGGRQGRQPRYARGGRLGSSLLKMAATIRDKMQPKNAVPNMAQTVIQTGDINCFVHVIAS